MNLEGIEISHPDKLLFPKAGISKGDVASYYHKIGPYMLPYLKDRPVTIQRYPEGIDQPGFFQKHAKDYFPDFVERVVVPTREGKAEEFLVNNLKSLIYLANLSGICFHIWLSRREKLEYPDKVIFDLDPSRSDFDQLREGALKVREYLIKKGIETRLMTTGKKGLHLYYSIKPQRTFDDVRAEIRGWAEELVNESPDLFTLEIRKKKRGEKIFLDILRNAYAQTGVSPYSLRPIPSAGVATPIEWHELENINAGDQFTYHTIFERMS